MADDNRLNININTDRSPEEIVAELKRYLKQSTVTPDKKPKTIRVPLTWEVFVAVFLDQAFWFTAGCLAERYGWMAILYASAIRIPIQAIRTGLRTNLKLKGVDRG